MALAINVVGDVVDQASTMLALADSERFELLRRIRRLGAASASDLDLSDDGDRLTILADAGLIERNGATWRAIGSGLLLDVPDDPEARASARNSPPSCC